MGATGQVSSVRHRVLVTGGAGFIGASLVRALEARGNLVRVLDDGRAAGFGHLTGTSAELIADDLLAADLPAAVAGVDAIVHLAAQTGVGASIEDPRADLEQNVVGTVRLLEAARAAAIPRFVLASSAAVMGRGPIPADEHAPARPTAPYGAGKLAAEAYLSAYAGSFGLCTTSLRIANAYGPFSEHQDSAVPAFIRRAICGEPLTVYGDGSQTRDFVHVSDVVQLVLRVLDEQPERVGGRVFNAGSGHETPISELARIVLAAAGPGSVRQLPARPDDVPRSALDIGLARRQLGYEPCVTLERGIPSTVAWFRDQSTVGLAKSSQSA